MSALCQLAAIGDDSGIRRELAKGTSPNATDAAGDVPLFFCCDGGHIECARLLIDAGATIDLADAHGATALIAASHQGHSQCVGALIGAGASVDLATSGGTTPLQFACFHGRVACVKLLLGAKASVDAATPAGNTALIMACRGGHVSCARLLLESGAAVDLGNVITPLLHSCVQGHVECAQLLCSYGASRAPLDSIGPADAARASGHAALAEWLERSDGWEPLHHLEVNSAERTRALLRGGASVELAAGTPPVSPLERAQQRPKHEAAQLVIAAARPWSPATHSLFPPAARARAVELLRIGYHVARSHYVAEARALGDAWAWNGTASVMSGAVTRE